MSGPTDGFFGGPPQLEAVRITGLRRRVASLEAMSSRQISRARATGLLTAGSTALYPSPSVYPSGSLHPGASAEFVSGDHSQANNGAWSATLASVSIPVTPQTIVYLTTYFDWAVSVSGNSQYYVRWVCSSGGHTYTPVVAGGWIPRTTAYARVGVPAGRFPSVALPLQPTVSGVVTYDLQIMGTVLGGVGTIYCANVDMRALALT